MILFSDFQCPFSRRFALAILPELAKQYVQTGKLLIAFRQLPNQSIHPLAMRAARATQCAGRQRLFWPMHDFLFAGPGSLDLDPARVQISVRELDQQAFESCIARADDVQIYEDLASARALSVSGTPTFFLGLIVSDAGHPLLKVTDVVSGAKPLALFNGLIDRLISSRYAGGR
jgi:protein-disulfide isomerase